MFPWHIVNTWRGCPSTFSMLFSSFLFVFCFMYFLTILSSILLYQGWRMGWSCYIASCCRFGMYMHYIICCCIMLYCIILCLLRPYLDVKLDKHSQHLSLILNMNIATKIGFWKSLILLVLLVWFHFFFAVWRENSCHYFF